MTNAANSVTFQMMSRLFRYPERFDALREAADHFEANGKGAPPTAPDDLGRLRNEYVRLFVNTLPEVPCPPYGSWYLEGTLKGKTTVRLEKLYESYGFSSVELADHIGVGFEFLAVLAALGDVDAIREDMTFMIRHLNEWTPEFCDRVIAADTTGFYAGCAGMVQRVLAELSES